MNRIAPWIRILSLTAVLLVSGPSAFAQSVSTLVRQLEHKDPRQRRAAARDLGKLGPKALTAADALLRRALRDDDIYVRSEAVEALPLLGPGAVAPLGKALSAKDDEVARKAAWSLGSMGAKARAATPRLIRALARRTVQRHAARALGQIGPDKVTTPRAAAALARLLASKQDDTRRIAVEALGKLGPEAARRLRRALTSKHADVQLGAARQLVLQQDHSPPVRLALVRALRAKVFYRREQAAETLERMGPAAVQAVPALLRALEDKRHEVVQAVLRALRRIGPPAKAALPALLKALDHPRPGVRYEAARALGSLGPAAGTAVPKLVKALWDTRSEPTPKPIGSQVRFAAAYALQQIGAPAVAPLIKVLTGAKEPFVRLSAAEVLGNIGPAAKAAIPALRKAFDDSGVIPTPGGVYEQRPRTVRRAAATALAGIGATALPTLLSSLSSQDATHRRLAAQGIGELGAAAASAIPALTRALKDRAEPVRKAAGRSIRQIQYQVQYQRKIRLKRTQGPSTR